MVITDHHRGGLIQACQIRLHANDILSDEKRYFWLSSPLERHGTSSGTPIHFTFIQQNLPPGETVLITEGALKADTVGAAQTERPCDRHIGSNLFSQ